MPNFNPGSGGAGGRNPSGRTCGELLPLVLLMLPLLPVWMLLALAFPALRRGER